MRVPPLLQQISDTLHTHHARAVLVGGCVRDHFLQIPIKDYDVEVYGLKRLEELEEILAKFGKVRSVGKSFGILKLIVKGREYDFAFPRQERKTGSGHRGFDVSINGMLDFKTAARRRDFTINAMGYDIQSCLFLDPFAGRRDLDARILRHVDDDTFAEDPLRVYRGVQFCARFALRMHPGTLALCQRMTEEGMLEELPKERIFDELKKLLLQARRPSEGWKLIKTIGILQYFPPLYTLDEAQWQRLLRRLDAMAAIVEGMASREALVLMLSALCATCSTQQCETVLSFLSDEKYLHKEVIRLVSCWSEIESIYQSSPKERDTKLRKLSVKAPLWKLVALATADFLAMHPAQQHAPAARWAHKRAKKLGILYQPPRPLLQGKDLVALGYRPSPEFKTILERLYQLQLQGVIGSKKEAVDYLKKEIV